jgi:H+/Cl- antiporter ClcA
MRTTPGNDHAWNCTCWQCRLSWVSAPSIMLALVLLAGGCAAVRKEATANGISEAKQIMEDIAQDVETDAPCIAGVLPAVAGIYAGQWAPLLADGACFYNAIKLIIEQVKGGAQPPAQPQLLQAQTAAKLVKAAKK